MAWRRHRLHHANIYRVYHGPRDESHLGASPRGGRHEVGAGTSQGFTNRKAKRSVSPLIDGSNTSDSLDLSYIGMPALRHPDASICEARASACVSTYSRMFVTLLFRTVMAKTQRSWNVLFVALILPRAKPTTLRRIAHVLERRHRTVGLQALHPSWICTEAGSVPTCDLSVRLGMLRPKGNPLRSVHLGLRIRRFARSTLISPRSQDVTCRSRRPDGCSRTAAPSRIDPSHPGGRPAQRAGDHRRARSASHRAGSA